MKDLLKTVFWSIYSFPTYLIIYIVSLLIWAIIYEPSIWLFLLLDFLIFPPFFIWRWYFIRTSKKNDDEAWKVIHRIEAEQMEQFNTYPESLRKDLIVSGVIPKDWE